MGEERGLDADMLNRVRAQSLAEECSSCSDARARKILSLGRPARVEQFVYSHKGDNAFTILENLGLYYFTEILTNQSGFARKPSPELHLSSR